MSTLKGGSKLTMSEGTVRMKPLADEEGGLNRYTDC